ncbi:MAG: thiamine S protein [Desulfomicrobiaceae bacterium]|jgi:molybdopterin converting factor small subunit|nr:thiamine S protein [Desulfomicrobiaceae bacterium]
MRIAIKCFATLARFAPSAGVVELPEGARVLDLLAALGIPESEVKLVFRNNRHTAVETVLADGDEVRLFPAVGGG